MRISLRGIVKKYFIFLIIFVAALSSKAQRVTVSSIDFGNGNIVQESSGHGTPSGACIGVSKYTQIDAVTGQNIWQCVAGTWTQQIGTTLHPGTQNELVQYLSGGTLGGPSGITVDALTGNNLNVPGIQTVGLIGFAPGGLMDPRSVTCNAFGDFQNYAGSGTISLSTPTTLTLSSSVLTAPVFGTLTAVIHGAGPSGGPLVSTITVVNGTTATLTTPASTAVSGVYVGVGHDDTASIISCVQAAIAQDRDMYLPTPIGVDASYLVTKTIQASSGISGGSHGGRNFYIIGDGPSFGFNHSGITAALTEAYPVIDMSGSTRSGVINISVTPAGGDPANSLDTAALFYVPIVGGQSPLFFKLINSTFIGGHALGSAGCAIQGIDQVTIDGTQCMSDYVGLVVGDGGTYGFGTTNITSKGNTAGSGFGCTLVRVDNSIVGGVYDTPFEGEGCDTFQVGGMSYIGLNAPFITGTNPGGFISLLDRDNNTSTGWAVGDKFSIPGGTGGVGVVTALFTSSTTVSGVAIAPGGAGTGYTTGTAVAVTAIGPSTGTGLTVNLTTNVIAELHQAAGFEPDQFFGHNFRTEDQGHVTNTCSFGLNGPSATKGGVIEGQLDGGSGIEICGNGTGILAHYNLDTFTNQTTLFGNLGGMYGSNVRLVTAPAPSVFGTIGGTGTAFEGNRFDSVFSIAQIEAGVPANPAMNYVCQEFNNAGCQWMGSTFTIENGINVGGNATITGTLSVSGVFATGLMSNQVRSSYNFLASSWTVTGSPTITPGQADNFAGNTGTEIVASGPTSLADINLSSPIPGNEQVISCAEIKGAVGGETFTAAAYGFTTTVPFTATTSYAWYCTNTSRTINNTEVFTLTLPVAETIFIDRVSTTYLAPNGGSFAFPWTQAVPSYLPTNGTQVLNPMPAIVEGNALIAAPVAATPVRAGTVTITNPATTQVVTFSSPMSATPTSCTLNPGGSTVTGFASAGSLATSGFTASVTTTPTSTLTMTYQCVIDDSN
jgi:hypothetical protein